MASFQDILKAAYEKTNDYEKALNEAFSTFKNPMAVSVGGKDYAALSKPQIYKNSIDVNAKDFTASEFASYIKMPLNSTYLLKIVSL